MDEEKKNSNTIMRVVTGTIIGVVALSCFSAGGFFLFSLMLFFTIIGALELVKIIELKGIYPSHRVVIALCTMMVCVFALNRPDFLPFAFAFGIVTAFLNVLFSAKPPYIANIASTILCFTYASLPCFILLIRELTSPQYIVQLDIIHFRAGFYFLWIIFFATLFTDVFAFYVGKKFGKHELAPIISPKKTTEGSIAGAIGAVLSTLVLGYFINLSIIHSLMLGFLITVFAQLGDLSESLIKRDAGVKDSGSVFAGHGGILDRADSYIFSLPVAYFYIQFFILNTGWIGCVKNFIKGLLNVIG